jgi:hypothetical protein
VNYLSVNDIRRRWSCGRTFVYTAIAEMERGGYLRRIWLGRDQRLSVESVETWERLHQEPANEPMRGEIAKLRAANA